MKEFSKAAGPNDICVNCGCPRWRHHITNIDKTSSKKRYGHCNRCGSLKCRQFKRNK